MNNNNIIQPQDVESERVIIASCLTDGQDTFDRISAVITKDDFYDTACKVLYEAIVELANESKPLDEITAYDKVRENNKENAIGGLPGLYDVMHYAQSYPVAMAAAEIVKERSQARDILRASRLAIESISNGVKADVVCSDIDSHIRKISDSNDKSVNVKQASTDLKNKLNQMDRGEYVFDTLSTGIDHLDAKLDEGGIGNGEVFVISAPTSCGKSQLALNIVLRSAVIENKPVGIFSFEMPTEQLTKRILQTASAVNLRRFRDQVVTDEERQQVYKVLERVEKAPIYVENYVRGVGDLRSKARAMKRKYAIKSLVIDYLQLIPYDTKMSKNDGIAFISHGIKQLAIELNIPIILLAQVNREGARRESGLNIHDLKDSGDIENDADVILLMWAKGGDLNDCKVFDAEYPYIELNYKIAKNREGERDLTGKFKFINHIGRFQ